MAFFKRKNKKNQTVEVDELRISFEGETPSVSADFEVVYEDVLHGMEVVAANSADQRRIVGGMIILVVCGCLAIPRIFSFSAIWGTLFVLMMAYILLSQIFGPGINRRITAQKNTKEQKKGTLHLFPGGYQVVQHGVPYNVPFRVVTCYESSRAYVFDIGGVQLMVFNKEIFGDKLPLVKEILVANMGYGRRFFQVDEKGKALKKPGGYNPNVMNRG